MKNRFLIAILCLGLLTTYFACEKDTIDVDHNALSEKSNQSQEKITTEVLNWNEFTKKTMLGNDSQFFQNFAIGSSLSSTEPQITTNSENTTEHLLVDEIQMIEQDGVTTYTFGIIENSGTTFRNLVLKTEDNVAFEAFIVLYTPTLQWLNADHNTTLYQGQVELYSFTGTYQMATESDFTQDCHLTIDSYWVCALGLIGHYDGHPGCHQSEWSYVTNIGTECTSGISGGSEIPPGGWLPNPDDTLPGSGGDGSGSNYNDGNTTTNPDNDQGTNTNDLPTKPMARFDINATIFNCLGFNHENNYNILGLNDNDKFAVANFINKNGCSDQTKSFIRLAAEVLDYDYEGINLNEIIYVLENEQDYRAQMSNDEEALFDTLSANQKVVYLSSAKQAQDITNELFETTCEKRNGKGDAFKHALWNGLSSSRLGVNLTELLTTRHENSPVLYTYHSKEKEMDLYNNNIGRVIVSNGLDNPLLMQQYVQNAFENGELRYLSDQNQDDCRATFSSQLTPTNQ